MKGCAVLVVHCMMTGKAVRTFSGQPASCKIGVGNGAFIDVGKPHDGGEQPGSISLVSLHCISTDGDLVITSSPAFSIVAFANPSGLPPRLTQTPSHSASAT